MAERGRLYRWPRNRPFGDSKARPVLVVSPEAANEASQRRVVVPISRDPRLAEVALAIPLPATPGTGLQQLSYAMAWHPTTVLREQLEGPFGRISPEQLRSVLAALRTSLDLDILEPWQEGD
jgi:mRNA-degrading endonuclease toxin of MazEF toxin-antitoxin module